MLAETIIYKAEITTIIMLGIGILAMIAGTMMARKKTQPNDDRPETYASRGAFIPFVIGRRRVGSVVLWIEPDANIESGFIDSPFAGYGKGGGGKAVGGGTTYNEQGLHALCVGPSSILHAIYQNGEKIWTGPITPSTHPSGSSIVTASEGTFRIYWGFQDDPAVALIDTASNFEVSTRLPLVTKILWDKKRLGSSRAWPRLEYEIEVPCYSILGSTSPVYNKYIDETANPPLSWAGLAAQGLADPLLAGSSPSSAAADFDILHIADAGGSEIDVTLVLSQRFTLWDINTFGAGTIGTWTESNWSGRIRPAQPVANNAIKRGDIIKIFGNNYFSFHPNSGSITSISSKVADFVASGDLCIVTQVLSSSLYAWEKTVGGVTTPYLSFTRPTTSHPGDGGSTTVSKFRYKATRLRLRFRSALEKKSVISRSPSSTYKAIKVETLGVDGVNPAHMVSQLLFAPFPYGAHLDKKRFDINSLEEAAAHFALNEIYYSNIKAVDGEDMSNVLSRILTDIGMFISWEPLLGKYVFQLIRNPDYSSTTIHPEIKAEMLLALPELETVQGTNAPDKIMVSFQDAERNYRENNITFDDDGLASQEEVQYAEKIEISTTTNFRSASLAGYRRQMELAANQTSIKLEANHATRWMYPGLVIRATAALDDEIPLRVVSINRGVNSGKNEIECVVDNYDAPQPFSINEISGVETDQPEGGLPSFISPPVQDIAVAALEMPRYLSNGSIKFFFPRLRGNLKSIYSLLWTSRDDSSYFFETELTTPVAGGFLTAELSAAKAYSESATAAKIYPGLVDDLYDVEDLSSQDESFFLGRQIALIGNEICFLRRATIQIDDTWGIGELVRGRLGTEIATHPAGTPVFIFRSHQIKAVASLLFQPGRFCYAKLQPMGTTAGLTLDALTALEFTVQGSGFRPMPVSAVRLDGFRTTHARSVDVPVRWNYRSTDSPKTGMGMQGFGDPVGISKVQGEFRVTIYDPAAPTVIVRQEIVSEPTYTYTSANRIIDGFSDAADEAWTISVENLEAGYASNPVSKTFQAQA